MFEPFGEDSKMIEKMVYLPKDMDDLLRKMAKDEGVNLNTLIVLLLSRALGEKALDSYQNRLRFELERRYR